MGGASGGWGYQRETGRGSEMGRWMMGVVGRWDEGKGWGFQETTPADTSQQMKMHVYNVYTCIYKSSFEPTPTTGPPDS